MMTVIRKNQLVLLVIVITMLIIGYLGVKSSQTLPVIDELSDPMLTGKLENSVMVDDSEIGEGIQETVPVSAEMDSAKNFFEETRRERDRVRDEEVSRSKSQDEISAISNRCEKELIVESLIKAKGFNDVICFINNENINIIVDNEGKELETAQIAQIKETVKNEIGNNGMDLRIIVK